MASSDKPLRAAFIAEAIVVAGVILYAVAFTATCFLKYVNFRYVDSLLLEQCFLTLLLFPDFPVFRKFFTFPSAFASFCCLFLRQLPGKALTGRR